MSVTELSKFWATGLKNDRYLSVTFYLSYRDFVSLVSRCYVRGQGHICCPRPRAHLIRPVIRRTKGS